MKKCVKKIYLNYPINNLMNAVLVKMTSKLQQITTLKMRMILIRKKILQMKKTMRINQL